MFEKACIRSHIRVQIWSYCYILIYGHVEMGHVAKGKDARMQSIGFFLVVPGLAFFLNKIKYNIFGVIVLYVVQLYL